jgi:hypothetical protein
VIVSTSSGSPLPSISLYHSGFKDIVVVTVVVVVVDGGVQTSYTIATDSLRECYKRAKKGGKKRAVLDDVTDKFKDAFGEQ